MKILIVDDSKLHREYIVGLLEQDGHQCIAAATGQEALAKYKDSAPDLIILDVVLPDIQGHEIAEKIRAYNKDPNQYNDVSWVPIIFLSGVTDESYLEKCILAGGDDYLNKPINRIILKAKIYAMERLVGLQKKVLSQNNELKQREKIESLQKFSSGIAHEIRNPLASIAHSSQNLIRRLKPNLTVNQAKANEVGVDIAKIHEYIKERDIISFAERILESSKRVSTIIDALLKVTEHSDSPHNNANIIDIINDAIKTATNFNVSFQVPFNNITLAMDYSSDLPEIYCCTKEIELVIYSILLNSSYALVNIPRTPTITIKTFVKDNNVIINITDNGSGIPKNIISKVFDPFFTTKTIGQGLGLGLTVAYNIITNKHNGTISIASTENESTTVIIQLPILSNN